MFPLTTVKHDIRIDGFHNVYYFEFDKYHYHSAESHDFWEMVYVDKGRILTTSSGRIFTLGEGQAVFHRPGEIHSHVSDREVANNLLVVLFSCGSDCMGFFGGKVFDLNKTARTLLSLFISEAERALGRIPNDYNFKGALDFSDSVFGSEQLMEFHFSEFLIKLLREDRMYRSSAGIADSRSAGSNSTVNTIIEYFNENLYTNLTLNNVCDKFFIRKSQLSVIFREHTGKSPMQFFKYLKIEEAKKLLREDDLSVSEITDRLNFSGIHNFSRAFKNETGFSPTGYRKSVLLLQNSSEFFSD